MNRRSGFTLIELLVVIAIIAVLIALLVPAVQKVRESAARTECTNKLKQIGLALHAYHDTRKVFPPGWDQANGFGWPTFILPYMEQTALHNKMNFTQFILSAQNMPLIQTPMAIYLCPSDDIYPQYTNWGSAPLVQDQGTTSYLGSFGPELIPDFGTNVNSGGGMFCRNSRVRMLQVTDGTSNTFLVGERKWVRFNTGSGNPNFGDAYWAGTPDNWALDLLSTTAVPFNNTKTVNLYQGQFSSAHTGGALFVFVDGHVSFITDSIPSNPNWKTTPPMQAYQMLSGINDGGTITGVEF